MLQLKIEVAGVERELEDAKQLMQVVRDKYHDAIHKAATAVSDEEVNLMLKDAALHVMLVDADRLTAKLATNASYTPA